MADGTPIYDIKPYLPHVDSIFSATGGFASIVDGAKLTVDDPANELSKLTEDKRAALVSLLEEDPHPSYKADPERVYGFPYAGFEVSFKTDGKTLTIVSIDKA